MSGLSTATTRADLVMAVCGSVACAVRHCFQAAGLTGSVSVFGEGANSQVWGQMVADVLHRPLQIARKPEVGARGAAIAAMDAVGIAHDHDAWTRPEGMIEPRRDMAAQFDAGFEHYLKTLESARALWRSSVSR
jgi:erythritol kinase